MGWCGKVQKAITRKKFCDTDLKSTPLERCLTTADLSFVGIGCMLGSGVYVLTGEVAGEMAGPAATLSFAIAGKWWKWEWEWKLGCENVSGAVKFWWKKIRPSVYEIKICPYSWWVKVTYIVWTFSPVWFVPKLTPKLLWNYHEKDQIFVANEFKNEDFARFCEPNTHLMKMPKYVRR